MKITRHASQVRQGNLLLFTTSLRVKDLRLPGFYKIDTLDTAEGVGYQRLLNETRAKRLADYLLDAHKALEAFLPTSLLLATDKVLPFDEANSTLTIDTEQVGQFNVVDGQHRIRGLVLAAEKETDMNEFQVPVNIAVGLDEISQMCHFLIINYHPQSGWFDEGPSKGPPPCGRGLKPPEVLLLLVFFLFLLVADVVPNNGLV